MKDVLKSQSRPYGKKTWQPDKAKQGMGQRTRFGFLISWNLLSLSRGVRVVLFIWRMWWIGRSPGLRARVRIQVPFIRYGTAQKSKRKCKPMRNGRMKEHVQGSPRAQARRWSWCGAWRAKWSGGEMGRRSSSLSLRRREGCSVAEERDEKWM